MPANLNLNLPQVPMRPISPVLGPQPFEGLISGIERGRSLGLRERQMAMMEQESQRERELFEIQKQKAEDDRFTKGIEVLTNKQVLKNLSPQTRKDVMRTSVLPGLAKRYGIEINPSGFDVTDDDDDGPLDRIMNLIKAGADKDLVTREYQLAVLQSDSEELPLLKEFGSTIMPKGSESSQFVGTQGGQGVLFNPKTKTFESVPFPGSGPLTPKNMTEGQTTAALFAARGSDANQQLENLIQGGFDPTALEQGVQKILPNYLQGENAQALEQIGKNFVAAVLRKESGAAINNEEWKTGKQQYIPQPGDKPKTLMQKSINRQRAIQSFALQAGNVSLPSLPESKSTVITGPKPGAVMKGYRFKGGNPANRNNWEKI